MMAGFLEVESTASLHLRKNKYINIIAIKIVQKILWKILVILQQKIIITDPVATIRD